MSEIFYQDIDLVYIPKQLAEYFSTLLQNLVKLSRI